MAGESHLSLCQATRVRIVKSAPDQRSAASLPVASSDSATIVGKQAIPIPRAAHCLIVSTLENSITVFGLT